jgi:hypothetical protein
MRFKMPESLDGLSLEQITTLHDDALAEATELNAIDDDVITDEQVDDIVALADALAALAGASAELETAAQARADKLAAARNSVTEASTPAPEPDADGDGDEEDDEGAEPDEDAEETDDAEADKELEPVAASAARKSTVRTAASRAPKPKDIAPPAPMGGTLIASANVPDFSAGTELQGMDDLVKAFMARSRMFVGRKDKASMERYGVATLTRPENDLTVTGNMSMSEQLAVIQNAAKESRLPGGSLLASGGWCAPSDTLYTFCENETAEGLYSLPEVTITHGGLNFTKGPQLADLLADPDFGFVQTEAQAEAGTPKVCFEFDCPDFEDHRLDAFGYCFKAPILTASPAGWPELIRRFLNLSTIGWQYKMSAVQLSRVSTAIGAATDFVELGSVSADILDAVSLQAAVIRQQQFLSPTATIEVVLPLWAQEIFRADMARRSGQALLAFTNAQIQAGFAARNLSVQWINAYQPLNVAAGIGTAWPTTLEAMVYPAGTFVWGNNSVINLDTVYDSAGLEVNMYTAVFFEEAGMLINPCGSGRKVTIDISCLKGVTGANELSCIAVTP